MDGDLYDKWKMMWDAKEWSTQGFFLVNAFVALVIMSQAVKTMMAAQALNAVLHLVSAQFI